MPKVDLWHVVLFAAVLYAGWYLYNKGYIRGPATAGA